MKKIFQYIRYTHIGRIAAFAAITIISGLLTYLWEPFYYGVYFGSFGLLFYYLIFMYHAIKNNINDFKEKF